MNRPVVGVTTPNTGGIIQNLAIRMGLWLAGAKCINISPKRPKPGCRIDGLLVAGGTDVYPGRYNNKEIKQAYNYDHERDELEAQLLKNAIMENTPVFCICRGAQLLNVVLGGTLYTNIQREFEEAKYPNSLLAKVFFRKPIHIEPDSKLKKAFGSLISHVNSMHTQSINHVGDGLWVTSKEPNGIVQSVEHIENNYIVGVQFHPEFLIYRRDVRQLFCQFVEECRKNKGNTK